MSLASSKELSELLPRWKDGDRATVEEIFPLLYNEMRRLARHQLKQNRPNHTLQTTALVHETYLRLAGCSLATENRVHFLGIAAQLMHWILVDYERNRRAAKRGAGASRLMLAYAEHVSPSPPGIDIDLLALEEALERLAQLDSQQSQIVELRYFGGLSIEDTAEFLNLSTATVKRSWASARTWLLREMSRGECAHERRTMAPG